MVAEVEDEKEPQHVAAERGVDQQAADFVSADLTSFPRRLLAAKQRAETFVAVQLHCHYRQEIGDAWEKRRYERLA